jgi:hypothetical protein
VEEHSRQQTARHLHPCNTNMASSFRAIWRQEGLLTCLRINHTRLLHSFLLRGKQPPTCAGFEAFKPVVMKSSVLWNITPCSPLKVNRRFGETCHLHLQHRRINHAWNQCEIRLSPAFTLVVCLVYSSTPNTEATCSTEMSVDFQRTTRCYILLERSFYDETRGTFHTHGRRKYILGNDSSSFIAVSGCQKASRSRSQRTVDPRYTAPRYAAETDTPRHWDYVYFMTCNYL